MFGKKSSVRRGLKIIIVGCGKVGVTLVEQLSKEGHDITIVDKNAEKYRRSPTFMTSWDWRATEPVSVCRWKRGLRKRICSLL